MSNQTSNETISHQHTQDKAALKRRYAELQRDAKAKRVEAENAKIRLTALKEQKQELVNTLQSWGISNASELSQRVNQERVNLIGHINKCREQIYPVLDALSQSTVFRDLPRRDFFYCNIEGFDNNSLVAYGRDLDQFVGNLKQYLSHLQGTYSALQEQKRSIQEGISSRLGVANIEEARDAYADMIKKMNMDIGYAERKLNYVKRNTAITE